MDHIQKLESDAKENPTVEVTTTTTTVSNNDESPTDNDTSSHILNGSVISASASENDGEQVVSDDTGPKTEDEVITKALELCEDDVSGQFDKTMIKSFDSADSISKKQPPLKAKSPVDPTFEVFDFEVKIADLGNACWVKNHFTVSECC